PRTRVVHGDNMGQGQGPRPQSRQRQGRRSPGEAPWPRIVDNATDTMYPINGWIPLLVCVSPSLQPRTPASLLPRAGVRHFLDKCPNRSALNNVTNGAISCYISGIKGV